MVENGAEMKKKLIIIGAGGFAKAVVDSLDQLKIFRYSLKIVIDTCC